MPVSINLFRNAKEVREYRAGQTIFNQGDPADVMFVVIAGEVDVIYNGHLIDTIGEGDTLGEMGMIDKTNRSASAIARTDSKLVAVDEKTFTYLVQQTPYFALQVMRMMSERMRKMIESHHQSE